MGGYIVTLTGTYHSLPFLLPSSLAVHSAGLVMGKASRWHSDADDMEPGWRVTRIGWLLGPGPFPGLKGPCCYLGNTFHGEVEALISECGLYLRLGKQRGSSWMSRSMK